MNEMKPEDVMRALECCSNLNCDGCPFDKPTPNCISGLPKAALALLREKDATIADYILQIAEMQKQIATQDRILTDFMKRKEIEADKDAEIERLTIELQAMRGAANSYKMQLETARADAITEFEKRLVTYYNALRSGLVAYHIEQIAKEMREKQ